MKFRKAFITTAFCCASLCMPMLARAADNGGTVLNRAVNDVSDAALTTKIKAVFEENKIARQYKIHVFSNRRIVTLKGHVGTSANANYIVELARNVSGVRAVNNQLATP